MDEIKKQVAIAQRRLAFQKFLTLAGKCLFVALLIALVAIAVPKIWSIEFLNGQNAATWNWSWLGGAAAAGLLAAAMLAWIGRKSIVETAIDVDREFDLRERVSSVLALDEEERDSEFGQALVRDANDRISGVDVAERFKVRATWRAALPLLLAVCAFAIAFGLRNAQSENVQAASTTPEDQKLLKDVDEVMQQTLRKQLEKSPDKALQKAELEFRELMSERDKHDPKDKKSVKKMMSKMNDIKKALEKRQREIGDSEKMKKQLSGMKDIDRGAADKVAKSLKEGDYKKAQNEIQKLADKLSKNELSEKEKEQLAKQMDQLAQNLDKIAKEYEEKKQEMKEKIEQAKSEGDLDKAAQMQQQMESMEKQQNQMEQMKNLAQKMGECADCMGDGQPSDQQMADAQQALKDLQNQLEEMQQDAESLEAMQGVVDKIGECKGMLGGEGECENPSDFDSMAGGGGGEGEGGDGMGAGQGGYGERPEDESGTGFYDDKVDGKTKAGEAIIAGKVDGENQAGVSRAETREQIRSSLSEESDPLTDIRLPRKKRDHAKEYFEKIREGE